VRCFFSVSSRSLYLLELSLASETGYAQAGELLRNPLAKLLVIALDLGVPAPRMAPAYATCFLDVDYRHQPSRARRSAFAVLIVSLAMAASIGVRLW